MGVDYSQKAKEIKHDIITTLYKAGGSFNGGSMSCADIIAVLFHGFMRFKPDNDERDMFFLSKGHCSSALYCGLVSVGLIDKSELNTYGKDGSKMSVHPKKNSYPGVEASTGSLGHGLALATGSALAAKIMNSDVHSFVLMGDGECNEGSVWENAMFASKNCLGNLTVIVDRNRLQGCGRDCDILNMGDIGQKFNTFGFDVLNIDGHNHAQIEEALKYATQKRDKPVAIIAETVKGKGVSFMEDRLEWHYKSTTKEQYEQAMEELR